jgi:hypothetical protein
LRAKASGLLGRLVRPLAVPLKVAVLVVVLFRFHGSWVGLMVVASIAFLLFGVDRTLRRWVASVAGGLR